MSVEKRAIRQQMRACRRGLSASVIEVAGEAVRTHLRTLSEYLGAGAVVAYLAAENEVPTRPLIDELIRSGRPLYLPRTGEVEGLVCWVPGDPLARGIGGIPEPVSGKFMRFGEAAFVLVPVVAWDQSGARLGRGGGFYDRLLAQLAPGTPAAGLAYEFQQLPAVPQDSWDIRLHYVITERRVVVCNHLRSSGESFQEGGFLH